MVGLDQGSYQWSEADWSPRIWLRVIQFPWDPVIARKYLGISVSTCQYGHPRWVIWRYIFKELCTKGKKKAVRKPQRDSEEIWAQQFMIKTLKLFSLKGRRARGRCVEKALCRKTLAFQPGFQPPEATRKGALNFILFLCKLGILSTIQFHQRMKLYKVSYTLRTFTKQRANKYSTMMRKDITRITFPSHHKNIS